MAKELKQLIVEELSRVYSELDRCVVVGFSGISAVANVEIRRRLREHNIDIRVVKNSLCAQALAKSGLEELVGLFDGPCAMVTGGTDVVQLAQVVAEIADTDKDLVIRGGYGEGEVLASEDVKRFATIPPRPVLIAQLLSAAQGPLRAMVGTIGTFTRNLVGVLSAVAAKRDDGEKK